LRKIRVKIARKGYNLSYRRSYFADDEKSFLQKAAKVPFAHIGGAMERGAPLGHEIVFRLHVATEGAPAAATPEQISELSRFTAFASRNEWADVQIQRYFLDYWISGDQLNFVVLADGSRSAKLEFLAGAYDAEGVPMSGQLSMAEKSVPAERFVKLRREALHGRQQFDVPTQAAWLRVAARDPELNRVGTIEIRLPLSPEPPGPVANSPRD